jgi:predicted regulator of Ras-like GTPase activity (Roadblock/LC7/MglB family)
MRCDVSAFLDFRLNGGLIAKADSQLSLRILTGFWQLSHAVIPEVRVLDKILQDVVSTVKGARAAIFLDGEGESIAQAGKYTEDVKLLGAWKEIHLDHVRDIAQHLDHGCVHAVFFELDGGNEMIVPVSGEYCLLVFLSSHAHFRDALISVKSGVELLRQEIE